jgi:hypothetical protein
LSTGTTYVSMDAPWLPFSQTDNEPAGSFAVDGATRTPSLFGQTVVDALRRSPSAACTPPFQ